MIIGDKKVKEIVITNKEKTPIISITDNDIIARDGCSVEVIQDCCNIYILGYEMAIKKKG